MNHTANNTTAGAFLNRRSRSNFLKQTFPGGFSQASKQLNDKIGLFDAINTGKLCGTGKTVDRNSFVHWSRDTMSPTARSRGPDDGDAERDAFADMAGPFFCDFTGTEELAAKASVTTLEVPIPTTVRALNTHSQQYISNKVPVYLDFVPLPPMSPTGSRTSVGSSSHSHMLSLGDSEYEHQRDQTVIRSTMRSKPVQGFPQPRHVESPPHSPMRNVEQLVDVLGVGSHKKTLERAISYRSTTNNSLTRGTSFLGACPPLPVKEVPSAAQTAAAGLGTGPARRSSSPLLSTRAAPRPLAGTVRLALQYELPSLTDAEDTVGFGAGPTAPRVWHASMSVALHAPFHSVFANIFRHFYDDLHASISDVFFDESDELAAEAAYQASLPAPVLNLRQTSRNRAPRYRKDNTFLQQGAAAITDPTVSVAKGALQPTTQALLPPAQPRARPATPYSSVTGTNFKLSFYHEGQSAWRELENEQQWEVAMFDSVEHEGTLRVLISTPTLDAATISSSWRRSSGVRDQGQIMTLTGTGSAPGSPFQTQTRPLAQTQDSASDPEQIPRGGMALNVSLPVVLKGSPGSSCACSPSSKRAGRGRDQQKSSSQSVHSLAQSQSERELAVFDALLLPKETSAPFTTAALLTSTLPNREALELSASQAQLQVQIQEQEPVPLRLLSVPWVPSKHSKAGRSLTKLRKAPTTRMDEKTQRVVPHNIATISPLNMRANTVIVPRSLSMPEIKPALLTKPLPNPKRHVGSNKKHQDDITSKVIPSRRELLLNDDKVDSMIQTLEDQLLQTRWL